MSDTIFATLIVLVIVAAIILGNATWTGALVGLGALAVAVIVIAGFVG